MDPHKNLFYYYSGARKLEGELHFDAQLENNTTKTLINVFERCSSDVTTAFLNYIQNEHGRLADNYRYSLQRKPSFIEDFSTKIILCISPLKSEVKTSGSAGGIPDAWIYDLKGRVVVAVESKITGGISRSQLKGHIQSLGWKRPKIIHIGWDDIHDFFRIQSEKAQNLTERLLLKEAKEYLEVIGMDKFQGFRNEDFDYFTNSDKEYRPVLRKRIERFVQILKSKLNPKIGKEYKDFYFGNLGHSSKEWAWIAIKPPGKKSDLFLQCNFTIELKSEGMEVNAVIRNGRYSEIKKPIGSFYNRLENESSRIKAILKGLGDDGYIELFSRTSRQGKHPMSGNEVWSLVYHLRLKYLTNDALIYFQSLMRAVEFPGIHIGFKIPRGSKILSDPDLLFEQINKKMHDLKPILDFMHR